MTLRFEVRGTPVPQGSIRHLGKGRPAVHGNAKDLLPWRNHVQIEAQRALGHAPPIEGPVALHLDFVVPKPLSAPKRRRTWPTKRPDLSHLVRAVEDAMTAAGVWRDDSQVVRITAIKAYPGDALAVLDVPGVAVRAEPLEEK